MSSATFVSVHARIRCVVPKKEMKVRVPTNAGLARFLLGPLGRVLVAGLALFTILGAGTFTYFYAKYAQVIDQKLRAGPFANTAKIYAAPESVAVGDALTPEDIAASLHRSGYNESRGNPIGYYQLHPDFHRDFPRHRFLFRPGGRPDPVLRRQNLADYFFAG